MDHLQDEITTLLARLGKCDDREAEAELIPVVLAQLRRLAAKYMRSERPDHTLQPTALVNEAYLRLAKIQDMTWKDRGHFFGIAAKVMRQVLVDHARARNAGKRPQNKISLDNVFVYSESKSSEMVALDEALDRLAEADERASKVVELKFFGGLTFDQIARVLNIAEKTAKRDWQFARAWLHEELSK